MAAASVFKTDIYINILQPYRTHISTNMKHANRIYALNILRNRVLTHFLLDLLFCVAASHNGPVQPQSEKCTFIINWNLMIYLELRIE